MTYRERLQIRLLAWRNELRTNRYGYANIAPNNIAALEQWLKS